MPINEEAAESQQVEEQPSPSDLLREQRDQLGEDQSTAIELLDFAIWLEDNDVDGFVGEVGWPNNAARQSEALLWLDLAENNNIPVTTWAAGTSWPDSYNLLFFADSEDADDIVDEARPQGTLLTNRFAQSNLDWGVNVAGLEFAANGNPEYSAANPGELGVNYFIEPAGTYTYLASQGVEVVRLPFSWERLQPELYGPLDQDYLALITSSVDAISASGMQAILDVHNYGRYTPTAGNELLIGSSELPYDALSDLWRKIHSEMTTQLANDAIWAYDIMNEPRDLPNPTQETPAREWEVGSQQVLDAIRAEGYTGTILVPGYDWSKLHKWSLNHPTAWINDPLNNFVYQAHHYWDEDRSGTYQNES